MDATFYPEENVESSRFDQEIDTIRARDEGHTNFDSWIEKEKHRLWLGYFSIKI